MVKRIKYQSCSSLMKVEQHSVANCFLPREKDGVKAGKSTQSGHNVSFLPFLNERHSPPMMCIYLYLKAQTILPEYEHLLSFFLNCI